MVTITARIPDELNDSLTILSKETERNKNYLIKKALENYLEEKGDLLSALARIEKEEETISLDEIERKYGLED